MTIQRNEARDEFILESLRQAMPMLLNIAIRANVDAEDLRQVAAIEVLISYDRACRTGHPRPYLQRVIRNTAYDYVREYAVSSEMISLDAPVSEEDVTPLSEKLPAPAEYPVDHTEHDCKCTALYAALRRLPLEEQIYMREVHQLNAFNPLPPRWDVKPRYDRTRSAMSHTAYHRLRTDRELAASLEVY
jgi:DNA-directed RNA polymerase specialized sigma24 family protein